MLRGVFLINMYIFFSYFNNIATQIKILHPVGHEPPPPLITRANFGAHTWVFGIDMKLNLKLYAVRSISFISKFAATLKYCALGARAPIPLSYAFVFMFCLKVVISKMQPDFAKF